MKFSRGALVALAVLLSASPLGAQTDMAGMAAGFLGAYGSFRPSAGIPDAGGRSRLAPYLSPALNKMLADGAAAVGSVAAVFCGTAVQAVRKRAVIRPNKSARERGAYVGVGSKRDDVCIGPERMERVSFGQGYVIGVWMHVGAADM